MPPFPKLRRRDFLAASVLGLGGLAAIKVGGRWLVGPASPRRPLPSLEHLSVRQAEVLTAVALAMVGPRAEAAYEAGDWEPAADVDLLFGFVPPDQRSAMGMAILLFEEWTLGLRGFSAWDRATQRDTLALWRVSPMAFKRTVWALLHAVTASSFSGTEAGWAVMDYPGPCVGTGRAPGQSVAFEWDEAVP